jgi:hypothetical protein
LVLKECFKNVNMTPEILSRIEKKFNSLGIQQVIRLKGRLD